MPVVQTVCHAVTGCSVHTSFSESDSQTALKRYKALQDAVALAVQNPAVVATVSGYVLRSVLGVVLRYRLRGAVPGLSKSCKASMTQHLLAGHLLLRGSTTAATLITITSPSQAAEQQPHLRPAQCKSYASTGSTGNTGAYQRRA